MSDITRNVMKTQVLQSGWELSSCHLELNDMSSYSQVLQDE